ncbi:MAG: conserved phage C-terminal domain-containing protein [Turicibacter sp.]|nr:conserved phage C-terminal domain-containing protein [Turicibacter sp.]
MKRDFKGVWIPKEIWLSTDLKVMEKLILVEIDSLDNEDGCFASNEHFSKFFSLSKNRCSELIKSLEQKGYIDINYVYQQESKAIAKRVIRCVRNSDGGIRKTDRPIRNIDRGIRKTEEGYSENCEDNNTSFNNTSNNTREIKDNVEQSPTTPIPYKEIVDYLNQKLGTKYRSTSQKTRKLIKDRFDDKFTLEDFKIVIDKKVFQWQGTQFSDYLRPETLFGPKFEGYLNQQVRGYNNAKPIQTHGDYDSSGRQLL